MLFDRLVAGSLARRFAFSAAALAAAALLLTLLASWALVAQQHGAGLHALQKKEMDFHAANARGSLHALATRLGEVAESAILANALVDSAGRETYLKPYLNGARQVNGVPVQLVLTDFEGNTISDSSGASFSPGQLAWLRRQMGLASDAATVMEGAEGAELLAVRLLRYSRTQTPEGALLYKVRLADIDRDDLISLVAGPRQVASPEDLRQVDVPPAYAGLDLKLVRSNAPPADYSALLPHYALIFIVVLGLAAAVLLLGSRLALALTHDLRRLEGFSSSVVRDGFGLRRAEASGSREVVSLAHSINHMVDRLHHQHAQLQNESERFHQLANTIPQMAWIADARGNVEWYNDRWYAYTGMTAEQAAGEGWRRTVDKDELPAIEQQWLAGIASGTAFSLTMAMTGADRQVRRFFTQLAPLHDAGGRLVQWFGTNTDLSPLEQAQQAMRESEERLREGLLAANMAAWSWDLDSGKTHFSDNAEAVFGAAWEPGAQDWSFLPQADVARLHAMADDALARQASYRCEIELPGASGMDARWIEVRGKADSRADAPRSSSGIALDVSERKRAEEALRWPTGARTSSWPCSRTSCATRSRPYRNAVEIMELVTPDAPPQVQTGRATSSTARSATWRGWSTTCWTSRGSPRQDRAARRAGRRSPPMVAARRRDAGPCSKRAATSCARMACRSRRCWSRRLDPAGAGRRQPAQQRRQVHRGRRPHRAGAASAKATWPSIACATTASASRRDAAAGLRPVHAGRPLAGPLAGRPGHRPGAGQAGSSSCTAARSRRTARRRAGQRVRGAAAGAAAAAQAAERAAAGDHSRKALRAASWWSTTTATPPTRWRCC